MEHPAAQFWGLVVKDSTIIISGVIADSLPSYPVKNQLGFFNVDGSLQSWKKFRGDSTKRYGTFYNSLIATRDGGFAVTGYTEQTDSSMKALFMKFDSMGDVVFVREYDINDTTNQFITGEVLVEIPDGYLIGGDRTVVAPNLFNANIHLLKVDSLGNIQWWKSYGTYSMTEADVSILKLTDTSYLIGYAKNNWYLGAKWDVSHTQLMEINLMGDTAWLWTDYNDSSSAPFSLQKTKDGGFAYCGRLKHSQPLPYEYILFQGGITKLDSAFNIQWRKRMGSPNPLTCLYSLRELPDGAFIAGGTNYIETDTFARYSGWFVKISSNGDSIWEREYQSVTSISQKSDVYDFELLPDGGIIACGLSQDNTAPFHKQQGWLIRLDSAGCLIPGCDTVTATAIKETSDEVIGVKVYPNPASEMVFILLKSEEAASKTEMKFAVYDMTGQQVVVQPYAVLDVTYMLNVSDYPKGTYLVEVTLGNKAVYRKFVKD